ncbi:MAG: hypothetical protein HYZ90_03785, partial [Candidatus Omnitrophica bacterium]|nr:hypothetical protein [Candidatus Omnitrophota bacterium]
LPWLPTLDSAWGRSGGPGRRKEESSATGWYYQSTYNYLHSNVLGATEGTKDSLIRFETLQEIFYPMRILRFLNFRPFANFREVAADRAAAEREPQFIQTAATGFDLNTKFFRTFSLETNLWGLNIHGLRHIVTPTLGYLYQGKSNTLAPQMRGSGVAKGNTLSPSIENKLQAKRSRDGRSEVVDLVRFIPSTSYDLEGTGGRGGRLGNVGLDLETNPYPWMSFESDASIDPHVNFGKPQTLNFDLVLHEKIKTKKKGESESFSLSRNEESAPNRITTGDLAEGLEHRPWLVGLGWRYQRETSAQLAFETGFNLGRKWRLEIFQPVDVKRYVTETTVDGSKTAKKIYGIPEGQYRLTRDLHEWTVELIYDVQRSQGESVMLLFRLKGAPELPLQYQRSYHQPKAGKNFPK